MLAPVDRGRGTDGAGGPAAPDVPLREPWAPAPLTRNVAANWVLLASGIVYSLTMTPLVIRVLGTEGYGVWSFLFGLATYADLFYLGLGAALVKYVAEFRATRDRRSMQRVCSAVFTVYVAVGAVLLGAAIGLRPYVPELLGAPLTTVTPAAVGATCVLIGVRLAAMFAGSAFGGVLVAYDRNDLVKGVMIAFTWVRLLLVATTVHGDSSMIALGMIFAITAWIETGILGVLARAATGGLRIGLAIPQMSDLTLLYGFGLMSLAIQLSSKVISYSDTTVIGVMLGAPDVAVYVVPLQMVEYGRFAVLGIASVFLPRLVAIHVDGGPRQLGPVFIRVARLSCFLGAFLYANVILLGEPFLQRWVGPSFGGAPAEWILLWLGLAGFCQILSTQVALPFYQSLHQLRVPVVVLGIEALVNLGGSVWLAKPFGISGVAFATFLPALVVTSVIVPADLCRKLHLPLRATLLDIFLPSLVVGTLTAAVLIILNILAPGGSYLTIALKACASCGLFVAVFLIGFPGEDRHTARLALSRFSRRVAALGARVIPVRRT